LAVVALEALVKRALLVQTGTIQYLVLLHQLAAAKVEKLIIFPVALVVLAAVAQVQTTLLVALVFLVRVIMVARVTRLLPNTVAVVAVGQERLD